MDVSLDVRDGVGDEVGSASVQAASSSTVPRAAIRDLSRDIRMDQW